MIALESRRHRDRAASRVEQWLFTLAVRRSPTTYEGGNRHSLDSRTACEDRASMARRSKHQPLAKTAPQWRGGGEERSERTSVRENEPQPTTKPARMRSKHQPLAKTAPQWRGARSKRQNSEARTVGSSRASGHGKGVPMTTTNVPDSSVRSHRFVSRPAAQPPIFGLVRRGKGPLGYSSSGVRSPNIPQGNGPLCCGSLDGRPLDGRHGSGHHLFNTERLGSERLGSGVTS
jgi:hypothetical protein